MQAETGITPGEAHWLPAHSGPGMVFLQCTDTLRLNMLRHGQKA